MPTINDKILKKTTLIVESFKQGQTTGWARVNDRITMVKRKFSLGQTIR